MLIARLLDPRPGELVADTCAAPGTKATHLASSWTIAAGSSPWIRTRRGSGSSAAPPAARHHHRRGPRGRRGLGDRRALEGPLRPRPRRRALLEPGRAAPQSRREVAARRRTISAGSPRSSGASWPPRRTGQAGRPPRSTPPARSSPRRTRRSCGPSSTASADWRVDPPADFPVAPDADGVIRCLPHVHGTDGFTAIRLRRRRLIKAHLLRWRPRQPAQRRATTPRRLPSGAASQLDLSQPPATFSGDRPRTAKNIGDHRLEATARR